MSVYLRGVILISAIISFLFIRRKLAKSQLKLMDSLFWILFSVTLVFLAIFPEVAIFFANLLKVMSAANFVFLVMLFLLILNAFLQQVRIASLEAKVSNLVQELAIREFEVKNEEDK